MVVVALVTATIVLPVAALGVDLGMQRVARRDMQAMADMVARPRHDAPPRRTYLRGHQEAASWKDGIRRSVARNLNVPGAEESELVHGPARLTVAIASDGRATALHEDVTVRVSMGDLDPATGAFTLGQNDDVPSAVHVEATTAVDFSLATGEGAPAGRRRRPLSRWPAIGSARGEPT